MEEAPVSPVRSGLSKGQTRDTLESFNWNQGLRSVFDTTCGGSTFVFVAFALALGIASEHIAVFSTAISAACILQIVSIAFNRRVRDKKKFVLWLAVTEPLVMILAVLVVPFLPQGMRLYALAVAAFAAAGTAHLTRPVFDEWVASTIPAALRGRYFGRKLMLLSIVSAVTTLVLGYFGDMVVPGDAVGFAIILAVGGVFGFLAVLPLRQASLPILSARAAVDWSDLPGVFRHRPFRRFLVGSFIITLPFYFGLPFYQVFHLEVLKLSTRTIAYISVIYVIVKVAMLPLIGRRLVRWGPERVLLVASTTYSIFFFCYPLAAAAGGWSIAFAWCLAGACDGAWGIAWNSAMYASVPNTLSRPAYFAVVNLFTLGAYAVGAVVAMKILEAMRDWHVHLGPFALGQYHLFFAGCGALMLLCSLAAFMFISRPQQLRRAR
jgi:MFS family permease